MPDAYLSDLTYLLGRADDPKIAWFLTAAAAVLGASVGSFLNVVVYRLPRGMSLSHPGSRCPHCLHAIRWFDNVPVLGWLWLGGRCRDCHAPIAARYPLVEALTGALAAGLFWLEVVEHGANLPGPRALGSETTLALMWLSYGYHLLLALTLVAAGFMAYDRQRLPLRLWAPALIVGLFAPLFWPELRPVPMLSSSVNAPGPLDGIVGMAVGLSLGARAVNPWPSFKRRRLATKLDEHRAVPASSDNDLRKRFEIVMAYLLEKRDQAALTSIVGLFLGWQAVGGILLVSLLLELLLNAASPVSRRGRIALPVWTSVVTLGLLFDWRGVANWLDLAIGGTLWILVLDLVAYLVLVTLSARWRAAPSGVFDGKNEEIV